MEHHNPKRMASTYPREEEGDYIPMPHEFHQPPLSHQNRYNPMLYRPWEAYGGESRPRPHHIRPPPSPQYHRRPLSNPRGDEEKDLLHCQMEAAKQIFCDINNKLDTLLSTFEKRFDNLAAQIQENASRLALLEEVQKKHSQDLQDDARKLHGFKRSLDSLWENFETETTSSNGNLEELTTCLNITAIKAHEAEKALEETKVTHQEAFSTILVLTKEQAQHAQAIEDVKFSLAGRFNDLIGKTTALKGEAISTSNRVKQLDDRLTKIEETVEVYIPSEKREVLINEPNQFDEDGEHDLRRPHLHAKGNLKPLEDLPPP